MKVHLEELGDTLSVNKHYFSLQFDLESGVGDLDLGPVGQVDGLEPAGPVERLEGGVVAQRGAGGRPAPVLWIRVLVLEPDRIGRVLAIDLNKIK